MLLRDIEVTPDVMSASFGKRRFFQISADMAGTLLNNPTQSATY